MKKVTQKKSPPKKITAVQKPAAYVSIQQQKDNFAQPKKSQHFYFIRSLGSLILFLCIFLSGMITTGILQKNIEPRSFLSLKHCENTCLHINEIVGLAAAIGITHAPGLIPNVVYETDKNIAMEVPFSRNYHVVIFPKKDIKNIGVLSNEEKEYLTDAYAIMQKLIADNRLSQYLIYTNGPGYQKVAYLHFHLEAK